MKNLKDKITNVCGAVLAVSGIVLTLATGGLALPAVIITTATAAATVSGGLIAYFTGKNPDGSTKELK